MSAEKSTRVSVHVAYVGEHPDQASLDLEQIKNMLHQYDIPVVNKYGEVNAGTKIIDPIIGLTIASVTVSVIAAIVDVLSFHHSQKPVYKITLQRGDITIEVSSSTRSDIEETLSQWIVDGQSQDIAIILRNL